MKEGEGEKHFLEELFMPYLFEVWFYQVCCVTLT